jgi:ligand-binding sensor domain-containing protein
MKPKTNRNMRRSFYLTRYAAAASLVIAPLFTMGSTHFEGAGGADKPNSHIFRSHDIGFPVKTFFAVFIDQDNTKWFLTEQGIVSFNGGKWTLHNNNKKLPAENLKDIAWETNSHGQEIWIASPKGATVATLPIDASTGATTYHTENTTILSNNVLQVAVGKSPLRWFGTDRGISAFRSDHWLTPGYDELYPETMFHDFPITSMATSITGDSLYVGTEGAGISRVYRDDVDGISGASTYSQWGPILLPSDKVYSIFIAPDGRQWFGTDQGVAMHAGNNTLEKWTVYNTDNGLVSNFVQAIAGDSKGNLWFGTKEGVSVFNGSAWTTYTKNNGLNSDNVQCIAVDKNNIVWLGTDDGVTSFSNGEFISYH